MWLTFPTIGGSVSQEYTKEASLKKRLGQLTVIMAIILDEGETEIYEWLQISEDIPIFKISETSKISTFI
jgi:hypothetical protein